MKNLFVIGFIAILAQVALLRELSVAFFGIELIYTLAIGAWLFWTGCGAMIGRKILQPSLSQTHILFILLSAIIPVNIAFIRSIRILFGGVPGAYLSLTAQIAAMAASLLPIGLILGLLFQWTAKTYIAKKQTLAIAYSIESLGGLCGGLCATLFLQLGFQNIWIAFLCSLIAAGSLFCHINDKPSRPLRIIATVFVIMMIISIYNANVIDKLMTTWTHPQLIATKDSPYSRFTITRHGRQVSVFENDALIFESEGIEAEEFVHLAALQHQNPQNMLILGGGITGIVHEALQHSPSKIDYVDYNPVLLNLVPAFLSPEIQKSLHAENVRIITADPRRFLDKATSYDLILIGMPEPSSGQANRFYTQEFFQQCSARLNDRGIIAFSLKSSENLWTELATRRMVSIYRAAKSSFSEILVIPGSTNIVICSKNRLTIDPSILALRFKDRGIQANLVSAAYLRYLYTNDRFGQIAQILESGTAPVNADAHPACYQYTIMIWLSKFLPAMKFGVIHLPETLSGQIILLLKLTAMGLPIMLLLSRTRRSIRRALLMGIASAIGMVLETILILHYQTKNGILYQDVGILLTGFMAGLTVGAGAMNRCQKRISAIHGIALLLGLVAVSVLTGLEIDSGRGALEILLLLFFSGFFVAGIFTYASLKEVDDQRKVTSPLYAADLIGGCLGSLVASLLLAPLAGLDMTAYMTIPFSILLVLIL